MGKHNSLCSFSPFPKKGILIIKVIQHADGHRFPCVVGTQKTEKPAPFN